MAINQSQVDSIISSASSEDPEIQLLKLKDEMELLKTSIKRLLIDIRERMNDAENPLVQALKGQPVEMFGAHQSGMPVPMGIYEDEYDEDEEEEDIIQNDNNTPVNKSNKNTNEKEFTSPILTESKISEPVIIEPDLLESLRKQIFSTPPVTKLEPIKCKQPHEKVKIQKVYSLFEWTTQNVKKYGHDRVDLMLESYKEIGYITNGVCKQVKDISRLMFPSIGELHEIKADEFVLALYELNRILQTQDSSLDRDMIDVLIERQGKSAIVEQDNIFNTIEDENTDDFEYIL